MAIDMKKFYESEEYLKALYIAEELWEWLCDNPDKSKMNWPNYTKYRKELGHESCSICEVRCSNFTDYHCEKAFDSEIEGCFLNDVCLSHVDHLSEDVEKRQKYAERVYFAVLTERLKRM